MVAVAAVVSVADTTDHLRGRQCPMGIRPREVATMGATLHNHRWDTAIRQWAWVGQWVVVPLREDMVVWAMQARRRWVSEVVCWVVRCWQMRSRTMVTLISTMIMVTMEAMEMEDMEETEGMEGILAAGTSNLVLILLVL